MAHHKPAVRNRALRWRSHHETRPRRVRRAPQARVSQSALSGLCGPQALQTRIYSPAHHDGWRGRHRTNFLQGNTMATNKRTPGRYGQDEIAANRLEAWPNEYQGRDYVIHFEIPEFTCL